MIARRVPRPADKQAKLGEDADWEYGAFVTNTPTGQLQWLDARHRTQAHVEDRMQFKARGARNLPSIDYDRNAADRAAVESPPMPARWGEEMTESTAQIPERDPELTRHGYRRVVPAPRRHWYRRTPRPAGTRVTVAERIRARRHQRLASATHQPMRVHGCVRVPYRFLRSICCVLTQFVVAVHAGTSRTLARLGALPARVNRRLSRARRSFRLSPNRDDTERPGREPTTATEDAAEGVDAVPAARVVRIRPRVAHAGQVTRARVGGPLDRALAKAERGARALLSRRASEPTPGPVIRLLAVPGAAVSAVFTEQMREALLAALHSLANNRLRSLLTTVGIIAGVAAVIVLVALGDGMTRQFQAQTDKVANQINISAAKGSVPDGGVPRDLTDQDVKALQDPRRAPDIAEISPAMTGTVAVTEGQAKDKANLVGVNENYARLVDRRVVAGRWFTAAQITGGDRRAILGPQAVTLLFGAGTDPAGIIGLPIRLSHNVFTIQGVFDANGQSDNVVAVPFDAARAYLTGNNAGAVDLLILKSTSVDTIDDAVGEVVDILDKQHHIRLAVNRDYNVTTFTDSLKKSKSFIHYLTLFIVAIAAISLFVGGVGVANIMLVSVTERTSEIGIRKAIGAPTTAILRQFLSEAVILTGLGGLIGVILGVGIVQIATVVMPRFGAGGPDSDIPVPVLSITSVLVAFGVSLIIGVFAGGYPANRAARLRPIEALRFE